MPDKACWRTLLLLLFLIILLVPFISMLIYSFFARWPQESLLPQHFTLNGFAEFWKRDSETAFKSVLFSLGAALITLLLCIPTARGLLKITLSVRRWAEAVLYLPMLLPMVSVTMGSHKMFLSLSLTGMPVILLMHIYFAFPYVFRLVYSCYAALGVSNETAAKNLGAGPVRIFFLLHLPVYLFGYMTAFMMGFIISYSQYFVNFYFGNADNINFSMIMTPLITGSNRNIASVYTLMYLLFGSSVILLCSVITRMQRIRTKKGD